MELYILPHNHEAASFMNPFARTNHCITEQCTLKCEYCSFARLESCTQPHKDPNRATFYEYRNHVQMNTMNAHEAGTEFCEVEPEIHEVGSEVCGTNPKTNEVVNLSS